MKKGTILLFMFLVSLLALSNAQAGVPGFMKARMGTLEGQFFIAADKPHVEGIVSFFDEAGGPPPLVGTVRRVPDMVARTDKDGNFSVKLLPGKYFMGALIREANKGPGPPREGEDFFFAMVEGGKLRVFEVKTKEVSKAGTIMGLAPDKFSEFKDFVVIKGKVSDESGKPSVGVMVTVKEEVNAPRPKFISERTKEDGLFELRLPPGRYFLMARESLQGGRPRPGSYIGTYGKTAPAAASAPVNAGGVSGGAPPGVGSQGGGGEALAVEAEAGKTYDGIDIVMFKIPDPEETRKKYEEEARIRKEETPAQ